jgi:fatty-acyl-CoA synthase
VGFSGSGLKVSSPLQDKLAKFWIPEKFVFVEAIPKTSVGKFNKKVLRTAYAEGELG